MTAAERFKNINYTHARCTINSEIMFFIGYVLTGYVYPYVVMATQGDFTPTGHARGAAVMRGHARSLLVQLSTFN